MSNRNLKAVWSLWNKPFKQQQRIVWKNEKYYLLAWILSVETARKHYAQTALYTDDDGVRALIDAIGLEFDEVSTVLNDLEAVDPNWWVMGKLYAYREQTSPFIHLDNDVFLWNELPDNIISSSVFTQNPEHFPFDGPSWYRPKYYHDMLQQNHGWAPPEWDWYISQKGGRAYCCGILGGQRPDFISYYADQAITFLNHGKNRHVWEKIDDRIGDSILFEQYYLSACVTYHSSKASSQFADIKDGYLFESDLEAFGQERAKQLGYTHLIGDAKRNTSLLERMEKRVARDYPDHYRRCIEFLGHERHMTK